MFLHYSRLFSFLSFCLLSITQLAFSLGLHILFSHANFLSTNLDADLITAEYALVQFQLLDLHHCDNTFFFISDQSTIALLLLKKKSNSPLIYSLKIIHFFFSKVFQSINYNLHYSLQNFFGFV